MNILKDFDFSFKDNNKFFDDEFYNNLKKNINSHNLTWNINDNVVNDIIFNFGYNKKKYEINNFKNISIGQITIMNFIPMVKRD